MNKNKLTWSALHGLVRGSEIVMMNQERTTELYEMVSDVFLRGKAPVVGVDRLVGEEGSDNPFQPRFVEGEERASPPKSTELSVLENGEDEEW